RWKQRQKRAKGEPSRGWTDWNSMPTIRNEQQPVERGKIMGQSSHVTDSKTLPTFFAQGCCQHQSRRNPRKTGDADFGKGGREQQTGCNRQWKTASPKDCGVKKLHPSQVAPNVSKRN